MGYRKANEFAFDEARKESFRTRLKKLIGGRSVRAAAKDWGLSFSTLNNYLTRGTEPSLVAMIAVASKEKVSLDWIAFGTSNVKSESIKGDVSNESQSIDPLAMAWNMIFSSLNRHDIEALISLIHREGARGILSTTEAPGNLDQLLLGLPKEEKERLLALHEAKKGALEERQEHDLTHPVSKQAG
ncbi:TPA: hypothetical protein QIY62_003969 [Serratia marcescens]|nr:hypothetical protein [Serratia marcescens]